MAANPGASQKLNTDFNQPQHALTRDDPLASDLRIKLLRRYGT